VEYTGLTDAESELDELLVVCEQVLAGFEAAANRAAYDPRRLAAAVASLKTCLYTSGVRSLVGTLSPQTNSFSAEDSARLNLLFSQWKSDTLLVDEQLHEDFLEDLSAFSVEFPDFFSGNVTIRKLYEDYLWNKIFAKYEAAIKRYQARISSILQSAKNKYAFYVNSDFATLSPFELEQLVAEIFHAKGYQAHVTPRSGDYGVDVIAECGSTKVAIQVKKYMRGNNVGNVDVQKILGGMSYKHYRATEAVLVTTSDFSKKARDQAEGNDIELWNMDRLKHEVLTYLCVMGVSI
jgi:hypothetical protein